MGISPLIRPGVSLAVGLSAWAGYTMAAGAFALGSLFVFAATFALTGAVSVLNQIQEVETDRLMQRTMHRPLAGGQMSRGQGYALCAALLAAAGLFLGPDFGWAAVAVMAVVLGLYNGLYTLLKPRTAWAMIPGALCGALPPWIGWLAGGGGLLALEPVYLLALFFIWQMPHFWMLAENNAADYAAAGFPVPANSFSGFSRQAMPRLWALALAVLGGMAPLFGLVSHSGLAHILAALCPAYGVSVLFVSRGWLGKAADVFLATSVLLMVFDKTF